MSVRHFYRLTFMMIALVLGLAVLQTSYAQRPLPPISPTTDDGVEESAQPVTQSSYAQRPSPHINLPANVNALELNETFDSATVPAGWQVTGDPGWHFDNPAPRTNSTGGAGNMAVADSDYEGAVPMDTSLLTPALNLSTAASVKLRFKTYFEPYAASTADVDVSIDGGATWTNLWQKTGVAHQGTVNLNVPQAAGQSSVQFRFHYYDANYAWYWQVDDAQVETPSAPNAPDTLGAVEAGNDVDLTWADNSDNETNFIIEQSPNGTDSWAAVGQVSANATTFTHKDVGCDAVVYYRVKAINGSLESGYSNVANITMSACPPSVVGINEDFNAAQSLPAGWTIPDSTWNFTQPNTTGGTGNAATGLPVNAAIQTPVFRMLGEDAVLLKFKTDIKIYAGQSLTQIVFVEISQDGGTTWTTVWEKTAAYKGNISIDISQWAANRNNLMVRFRNSLSYGGSYFQIDDVEIAPMSVPDTPSGLTATLAGNSNVVLGWSGSNGASYKIERSDDGGSSWSQIADITNGATSYVDESVASFTTYQYRVRAYNAAGQTAYSTAASLTTGDKSVRYVDVTISLYPTATLTTAADRANYEAVIGYFADAIFEASNGANRLRKVTFYRDAGHFDSAHVQWIPTCHPNANASGYIYPGTGARVEMCDEFSGLNFLTPAAYQMGGTVMAHEWGHFFYGMYDEYKGGVANDRLSSPQPTDPGSSNSLMTYQWDGFERLDHLNFSIPAQNFTLASAQGRVYGADAWAVLSRPKNEDPQNTYAAKRPYWPELAAAAPAAGTTQIDLPSVAAREQLEIVWEPGFTLQAVPDGASAFTVTAVNNVIREIVIDRSAAMAGSGYLDEAKSAVAALIEQSAVGDTIGIIAFDGTVTEIQPLTDITNDTVKDGLITAVHGITAGDANAAGGDALQSALDALIDPLVPNVAAQAVYYITAGSPNSGINATTVVPGYQDNGISLHIFGFDPTDGDEANLRLLSDQTEGKYTTVQDVTDLQKALKIVDQDTSQTQDVTLAYDYADVVAGDVYSYTIAVDETLTEIDFEFIYFSEADSVFIDVEEPDGYVWYIDPATDCETYDSGTPDVETSCYIGFSNPAVGNWTVYAYANAAVNEDFFIIDIETGVAAAGATTYNAVVNAVDSDVVEYPRPIVVEASVGRDFPIAGLNTRGWLFSPDGNLTYIDFRDDGAAPDLLPNDGTYSAYVDYAQNGEHWVTVHFDNYAGQAFYTDGNLDYLDESLRMLQGSLPTISESFERYAEVQVSVTGWQEDDHADWPDDPDWPATALNLDNIPVPGRIDFANDVDMFEVTVPLDYTESTLGLRINKLGLGMDPYVVVYAADYSWEFTRYLDFVPTADDALFIPVDVNPGETFFVEVWHYNETLTGTYNISAGKYLWSDPIARAEDKLTKIFLPLVTK